MEENSKPMTKLAWTSGQSMCPKVYTPVVATVEGASANFLKGFNQKSALYLAYSTSMEDVEQVITEIIVLSEKSPLPVGCAFIGEYVDPKITVPKKKRMCVKTVPMHSAESAVADIKLTVKNKQLGAPYIRIGDMSGLALWCKKVPVLSPKPMPKPRNILTGVGGLSLDGSGATLQAGRNEAAVSKPKSPLYDLPIYEANVCNVSAIDGIPFTVHPMFESRVSQPSMVTSNFQDVRIKTLADIENEYNYGFVVERTACTR